ncbi:unnamed protein product [Blepharisma stoltei]|uniref:Uncharacterized protein n=1 Tax=Blepharisma stoltei TaxID=1481888 RepID=A0AAU9JUP1_9CILI|nr:unnamed protein product [Blepharisma stoltei]
MAEEDKQSYLDGSNLFRFEFMRSSVQWGVALGALMACHTFSRSRRWGESIFSGYMWGSTLGILIFGWNYFKFTQTQSMLRLQTYERQETNSRQEYAKRYFREKFHLEELDDEKLDIVIEKMEGAWQRIEAELMAPDEESQ